jgi:hypothetical protein
MIEQLAQMQARLQNMRDTVLKEGSVVPGEKSCIINIPEVKVNVLWYLDLLAATVAGAHWHMSTVEHDDSLSATDKEWMQTQIPKVLHQNLLWLPAKVKSLRMDIDGDLQMEIRGVDTSKLHSLRNGRTREEVSRDLKIEYETFYQLSILKGEVADMLQMLGANVA